MFGTPYAEYSVRTHSFTLAQQTVSLTHKLVQLQQLWWASIFAFSGSTCLKASKHPHKSFRISPVKVIFNYYRSQTFG
jgi:hypothetical protein